MVHQGPYPFDQPQSHICLMLCVSASLELTLVGLLLVGSGLKVQGPTSADLETGPCALYTLTFPSLNGLRSEP